jgi:hypothetical protein
VFLAKTPVILIVFGKNADKTVCFWQYTAYLEKTELRVFGEYGEWNEEFSPKTQSETVCIFGENTVFAKIRLFKGILI